MNKSQLVDAIASKGDMSKAEATKALDAMVASIGEALQAGDTVNLIGFGAFSVKERAARKGHNPKTKEPIDIPASKVPSFKAGKSLKDAISGNGNKDNAGDNKSVEADKAPKKTAAKGDKKAK